MISKFNTGVYFFSFKTLTKQIIAEKVSDLVEKEIIKTKCKFWINIAEKKLSKNKT